MNTSVCRLCLGTENLVHVFDKKVADNMADIIAVTSGVEILKTDQITQMICSTCCQITLKIFKFRNTSIKNNQDLKAKRLDLSVAELLGNTQHITTSNASLSVSSFLNGSTSDTLATIDTSKTTAAARTANFSPKEHLTLSRSAIVRKARPLIPKKYQHAHLSLKNILRQHPRIELPDGLPLHAHYGPYITLLSDEVDEWFRDRGYTDLEIQDLKKEAALESSILFKQLSLNIVENKETEKPDLKQQTPCLIEEGYKKPNQETKNVNRDETCLKPSQIILKKLSENVFKTGESLKRPHLENNDPVTQIVFHKKIKMSTNSLAALNEPKNTSTTTQVLPKPLSANTNSIINDVKQNTENKSLASDSTPNLLSTEVGVSNEKLPQQKLKETENKSLASDSVANPLSEEIVVSKEKITLESILATSKNIADKPKNFSDKVPVSSLLDELIGRNSSALVPDKTVEDNCENTNLNKSLEVNKQISSNLERELPNENLLQTNWETTSNTDNDSVGMDGDNSRMSFSSNCSSFNQVEDAKEKAYFRSLQLAPKSSVTENQPDFSLLSLATNKSHQLYSCVICDSYHASLKDLKLHEKKQHTKCPFCSLKFRNLETRNDHVKYSCGMNLIHIRTIEIPLVRIDENETIKKQHSQAFSEFEKIKVTPEGEIQKNLEEGNIGNMQTEIFNIVEKSIPANSEVQEQHSLEHLKLAAQTMEKPTTLVQTEKKPSKLTEPTKKRKNKEKLKENDQILAMQEIEKYIKAVETITTDDDDETQKKRKRSAPKRTKNVKARILVASDVICISDDENDGTGKNSKAKSVGTTSTQTSTAATASSATGTASPATGTASPATGTASPATGTASPATGSTSSATITTAINKTKQTVAKQHVSKPVSKTLHNINMLDMVKNVSDDVDVINLVKRILTNRKGGSEPGENKNWEANNPILDGNSPKVKIFKNLRKHLHNFKIPIIISFSNKICAEYKPVKPTPEARISDLWTSMVPQDLKRAVAAPAPSSININKSFITKAPSTNTSSGLQKSVGSSQNQVATSNSFIITSQAPSTNVQTYTSSLILNGGPTVSTNNTFANLILLPSILTTQPSLPTSQGPLPIIQSVTSLDETSIKNVTGDQVTSASTIIAPSYKVVQPINGQMQLIRTNDATITPTVLTTSIQQSVEEPPPVQQSQPSLRVKNFGLF